VTSGKTSVFTIISLNYGAFARTLMESLQSTHPDWDRYVLIVDRSETPTDIGGALFTTVMVEDLPLPRKQEFLFRYGVMELNTAVKPFVENLTQHVSARCGVTNLGWITRSEAIHRANCNKIPALLLPPERKAQKSDRVSKELDELRLAIGLEPPRRAAKPRTADGRTSSDPTDHLANQLNVLKTMFQQKKDDDYHANFDYASQRALFTMKTRRPSEFGDLKIFTPAEMLTNIFAKSNVPTAIDWAELE